MRDTVEILEGSTFVVCDGRGDVAGSPVEPHGLFAADTRYLSRWVLTINGIRPTPLSVDDTRYYQSQFFLAPSTGTTYVDSEVAVIRRRTVGQGFHEWIRVTSHAARPARVELVIEADADFADLFEVKDAVTTKQGQLARRVEGDVLVFSYRREQFVRETRIRAVTDRGEAEVGEDGLRFTVTLEPQQQWVADIDVLPVVDVERPPDFVPLEDWEDPAGRLGLRALARSVPRLRSDWRPLETIYERSIADLAALRFESAVHPGRAMPAAGLPWFMTVFGRDSILTSYMALPFLPDLAETTLRTLADFQADTVDDFRDAEPGKIMHELRAGELTAFEERPHSPYYGTADATPLFLVLLDEHERWTGREEVVQELEGAARAALRWIDEHGDRDGDGFVEYERRNTATGLENQCWKDSWNSIQWADGTLASLPRATCELQGYVYDAKVRCARLARWIWDDAALADRLEEEAAALKERFHRAFWIEERGYFALALDGEKQRVDALSSNLGHLLWSGIVADECVPAVVDALTGPRLFSGWGVRTFGTGQVGYNPIGYHLGTVWPHDTALAVMGLARSGHREAAAHLGMALLEAAEMFAGRLPEAFAGFRRDVTSFPAEYPTACSPQAWASAAPLLVLRAVMGLEPEGAVLRHDPHLPPRIRRLSLQRIPGRWGVTDAAFDAGDAVVLAVDDDAVEAARGVTATLAAVAESIRDGNPSGAPVRLGFDLGEAGRWRIKIEDGAITVDQHLDRADTVIETDEDALGDMLRGHRNPTTAVLSGRARVHGDVGLALRLMRILWAQAHGGAD